MNIDEYLSESTGRFPASGCTGVESEWMHVGSLSIPCGDLWAGQFCPTKRKDGCVVKVPSGVQEVWIKGMDFNGHRRTARVRVCPAFAQEPALAESCGVINVDVGAVSLCDIGAFDKVVLRQYKKAIL